jgi:tRNA-Thr(GGU) m(6)t(6)A37 methyltransferase TsaA
MSSNGQTEFVGQVESSGELSKIKIYPEFCIGLQSLEKFSHILVLYYFHLRDSEEEKRHLEIVPMKRPSAPEVNVFTSESLNQPNAVGICVVELMKIEECTLTVRGLETAKGSPIICIKPYISQVEHGKEDALSFEI